MVFHTTIKETLFTRISWIDEWMDEWMDKWLDRCGWFCFCFVFCFLFFCCFFLTFVSCKGGVLEILLEMGQSCYSMKLRMKHALCTSPQWLKMWPEVGSRVVYTVPSSLLAVCTPAVSTAKRQPFWANHLVREHCRKQWMNFLKCRLQRISRKTRQSVSGVAGPCWSGETVTWHDNVLNRRCPTTLLLTSLSASPLISKFTHWHHMCGVLGAGSGYLFSHYLNLK